jgi:pimeloyl-ACP methyl ester carboxylesterase
LTIANMLGTLVQTTTSDGVKLHGFLSEPRRLEKVWLCVHGVNSNFYSSTLLSELGRKLATEDTAVLLVNTRGHDILSFNTGPTPMRVGSQIESLAASQLDLDAWVQFLVRRGVGHISLLGHSLGALKCLLWSLKKHDCLRELVAISPPRLNTNILLNDPVRGQIFKSHLKEASDQCENGAPEFVMKVRFPLPMWICASTYKDKYGSGDKYDYLAFADQLRIPTLWTFGQFEVQEGSANFRGADVELESRFGKDIFMSKQTVRVIEGADHSYRGVLTQLGDCIGNWLKDLS